MTAPAPVGFHRTCPSSVMVASKGSALHLASMLIEGALNGRILELQLLLQIIADKIAALTIIFRPKRRLMFNPP
jgi:hypothetical protein